MLLATFTHQPADQLDYDIDYSDWLLDGDPIASATVQVDKSGLNVLSPLIVSDSKVIKLWVQLGSTPGTYKVSVNMTTVLSRIKQDEIKFKVKDV